MKTSIAIASAAVLVSMTPQIFSQTSALAYRAVERGKNFTVMQSTRWITNEMGMAVLKTNRYQIIGNGLNWTNSLGQWIESKPMIQSFTGGIVCTGASYSVILASKLSEPGVVDFQSPTDRVVLSPLALLLHDPASGQSLTIAMVTNSTAELLSSNRVIYRDAFQGVRASIVMNYARDRFSQDVVLEEDIVPPPGFGPRTRLEIATEILSGPKPVITQHVLHSETNTVMAESDLVDETLSFGGARMVSGWAFSTDSTPSAQNVPVAKQLVQTIDGRRILIESFELADARGEESAGEFAGAHSFWSCSKRAAVAAEA